LVLTCQGLIFEQEDSAGALILFTVLVFIMLFGTMLFTAFNVIKSAVSGNKIISLSATSIHHFREDQIRELFFWNTDIQFEKHGAIELSIDDQTLQKLSPTEAQEIKHIAQLQSSLDPAEFNHALAEMKKQESQAVTEDELMRMSYTDHTLYGLTRTSNQPNQLNA
jgi:hypothetical protein